MGLALHNPSEGLPDFGESRYLGPGRGPKTLASRGGRNGISRAKYLKWCVRQDIYRDLQVFPIPHYNKTALRPHQLAILNGTVQVKGPGIIIEVDSAGGDVTAANILDAVQELRDAGAESIDVGGNRIVASSWFTDVDGRPSVEGRSLPEKFTISAIGDPHTMSTAMAIPGGVTDTLTQAGARVKVSEETSMQITSLHRRD